MWHRQGTKQDISAKLGVLLFGVLVIMIIGAAKPAVAVDSAQVRTQIGQAYAVVLAAEQSGGNVTSLVAKLNSALSLVQQADAVNSTSPSRAQALYSQASALASQVIQSAPDVAAEGRASVSASQLDLGIETGILLAAAVATYAFMPRIFWGLWLRIHRNWRVRKS